MSYGSIGRVKSSSDDGVRGDTILLGCQVAAKEKISVGACLYCRGTAKDSNNRFVGSGDWKPVQPSQMGSQNNYKSPSLGNVGVWAKWINRSSDATQQSFQLFLPYQAISLPSGVYQVRYRLRIWGNDKLIDDFYTDEDRIVQSTGSAWEEIEYICAAGDGPSIHEFHLLGTDDPPAANHQ